MGPTAASRYHARMQRVLGYIDEHLDDDLSVAVLSGVAAFSPHHFQRQFAALFGIPVHRYVQLLRLKQASHRLAFRGEASVLQIALDSGFGGGEAFARAFKRHMDQTPSAFRQEPRWQPWHAACAPLNLIRSAHMQPSFQPGDVGLAEFPVTSVAMLRHHGDPALVGDAVRRFIAWRRANGLPPSRSATFNVLHADPETTPPDQYRFDLCAAAERNIEPNDAGVVAAVIPAGPCAVLRLVGSPDNLRPAIDYLYSEWLPNSGRELRDDPVFVQRVSFYPDVPEHAAVTDIFLPLRPLEPGQA